LNGSFYAVGANGVTVRGQAFSTSSGEMDQAKYEMHASCLYMFWFEYTRKNNSIAFVSLVQAKIVIRGHDLMPAPSTWFITHLGHDEALQVSLQCPFCLLARNFWIVDCTSVCPYSS
jgi:hypothetical protein